MKSCTACGDAKQAADFSPDKRSKDGLQSRCKACCSLAKRTRYHADIDAAHKRRGAEYARNRESILANNSASRARHRESVLAGKRDYYERVKADPAWQEQQSELRRQNKHRKAKYDASYREKNSEKVAAKSRAWAKQNPEKRRVISKNYKAKRRAQEDGGIKSAELAAWEASARKVCHWCGKSCEKKYHIDHYQPLSKGGLHEESNLVIACPRCNLKKNAKDPYEFAASMGRLF